MKIWVETFKSNNLIQEALITQSPFVLGRIFVENGIKFPRVFSQNHQKLIPNVLL